MTAPENPAAVLRRAAEKLRKLAGDATPGPWERPLDVRNKNIVIAARPDDEEPQQWRDGIIPAEFASHKGITGRYAGQRERVAVVQCNTWSDGSHYRKRSGRDLEYIAVMHPEAGKAVAALLEREAVLLDAALEFCVLCGHHVTACPCPGTPLGLARAVLGESETS